MKTKQIFITAVLLLALAAVSATAGELKLQRLQAQLIWATTEAKSPNPKHKPVDGDVAKKLASLPLKWTHFFEEDRRDFALAGTASQKVELSDKCAIEVKNVTDNSVEVALFGNGKAVWKGVQPLPVGEILVLGGNAPGDSAWLVTLKRRD